ncbi:hypothetical protein QQ008_07450 [Fulvivirgaceae bacterium BMA10]|uniref:DUF4105 domain-containing protein n=1 Tax=Splendidivirga corallicola TaxID=3051826 RepID=A0ABT8KKF2_9BACT|nr:hypothetical protein [Fulvivirgaceae bacterium BMA10]
MRRFTSFVRKVSRVFITLLLFILIISLTISHKVKTRVISSRIPNVQEISDTLRLHFIHGSTVKQDCSYSKSRLGGKLGGHVELELNNYVYGFLYDSLPIHVFVLSDNLNSKFEKKHRNIWIDGVTDEMITTIEIPISLKQYNRLDSIMEHYYHKEPYDYAFFGQRCTSSTAEILSDAGIFGKFSNFESAVGFFYPRTLRFAMLKYATENSLEVRVKKGIACRDWEH